MCPDGLKMVVHGSTDCRAFFGAGLRAKIKIQEAVKSFTG
jgi:hypothetical protein